MVGLACPFLFGSKARIKIKPRQLLTGFFFSLIAHSFNRLPIQLRVIFSMKRLKSLRAPNGTRQPKAETVGQGSNRSDQR
jgi:hypothetical protein